MNELNLCAIAFHDYCFPLFLFIFGLILQFYKCKHQNSKEQNKQKAPLGAEEKADLIESRY